MVTVAALLLAACQGVTGQPSAPEASNLTPAPATAIPIPVTAIQPDPTAAPAATVTPEGRPTTNDVPVTNDALQPTPTLEPAPTEQTGGQHLPATQRTTVQRQVPDAVFYVQNGLTLEYYWPLDSLSNLSADEMEIFAYNESDGAIEFLLPEITFTENGRPLAQHSGTWEKFPSRSSWDRIEYIQIPPSPYSGEALVAQPDEKVKLHWHMEGVASTDTHQEVALGLMITTGAGTQMIVRTLVRGSEQSTTVVAAAPELTQEPVDTHRSTGSAIHVESSEATSGVR